MTKALRLGVIGGGGWLGRAILQSALDARIVSPENVTLSYRNNQPARLQGVYCTKDNRELADRSDVIVVSVRPADWPSLTFDANGKLVISVMAGVHLNQLSMQLGARRIVRALPNAGAEVASSFTPWIATSEVNEQDRSVVRGIFGACGSATEMMSEAEIDYLTGLAGSGPAFPALLASAMMRDAVAYGLDPAVARQAVATVLIGAGRLLELRDECPDDTVATFLDYRGTTAAAIEAMRASGFDAAVGSGLAAACRKSANMGQIP